MTGPEDIKAKSGDAVAVPAEAPAPLAEAEKPRPARFDFAGANQAHWRSRSAMRGKNAGPVKKMPTRR